MYSFFDTVLYSSVNFFCNVEYANNADRISFFFLRKKKADRNL
jgi:hypothetical protein